MQTAADVITAVSSFYHRINLLPDKQLGSYMRDVAWPEWGGHKQMVQGAKGELLEWVRRYLEPQQRGETFDHFEFSCHPYYPGMGIEVHCKAGAPSSAVRILPGRTRFCVFSHRPLESFASHVILDFREPPR